MIALTRLNGDLIAINPDRIERADVTPDVVLTMTDGSKYVIAESLDELVDRIRFFRASILALSNQLTLDGRTPSSRLRVVHDNPPPGPSPAALGDERAPHLAGPTVSQP